MNELNCDIVRDLLPLYHDRVVSEETEKAVRAHLEKCECCRGEYEKIDEGLPFVSEKKKPSGLLRVIRSKALIKGVLISLLASVIIVFSVMYLTMETVVLLSAEDYKIYGVYSYNGYNVVISDVYANHANVLRVNDKNGGFSVEYTRPVIYGKYKPEDIRTNIFYYPCENTENITGISINGALHEFCRDVPEYVRVAVDCRIYNMQNDIPSYYVGVCKNTVSAYKSDENSDFTVWKSWMLDGTVIYDSGTEFFPG